MHKKIKTAKGRPKKVGIAFYLGRERGEVLARLTYDYKRFNGGHTGIVATKSDLEKTGQTKASALYCANKRYSRLAFALAAIRNYLIVCTLRRINDGEAPTKAAFYEDLAAAHENAVAVWTETGTPKCVNGLYESSANEYGDE